ncbi:MAG: diphthine synthase [Crenarchaeota archaeon 13_1_40CM_2_52_14]|nr:MAG: diphthine synthase [Crenarchaeota archaeon 13_1_40CM_3_52_17]OLD35346.1 MAG: diphthine synthase [Crenarchaeota archaeon 13_1_40CM_2_52_14]
MSVTFVGLGLNDEKGLTVEGVEVARKADAVFAEFYTNLMPGLELKKLELLLGKKIVVLDRVQLEDENGRRILEAAGKGRVAFLVPGDPMIATTHVSIRLELAKRGVSSRIIHGPSIASAVCGATGLQSYKFGKTVTMPQESGVPGSLVDGIMDNRKRGLHSLVLLDIRSDLSKQLTVAEAALKLVAADPLIENWLGIGVARVGSPDQFVLARRLGGLQREDFGKFPHSLVIPGRLHFVEVEFLKVFCGAKDTDLESVK